jgi:hypothetical protein
VIDACLVEASGLFKPDQTALASLRQNQPQKKQGEQDVAGKSARDEIHDGEPATFII